MHAQLGGPRGSRAFSRALPSAAAAARHTAIAAPIVVTACQPAVLDPEGAVGIAEKTLMIDSLAIMLAIVIPTIAATFAFAWWFRASNTKSPIPAGFHLFRPPRAHRLGHSRPRDHAAWWRDLDRFA